MEFNGSFNSLTENYLFAEVADRVKRYSYTHPDEKILKMGIGDVTLPLVPEVIKAIHSAADEMAQAETFKGYGPYEGYPFLRSAVADYYKSLGVKLGTDEIFISDGAKSDLGNILDIFSVANTVLVPDPVYPVYADTNIMAGRRVLFADATEENGFLPMPDKKIKADIIYICSPNNPTGAAYTETALKSWVDFANETGAIILYDAAYERFVSEEGVARSVFRIEGARTCAIEFCSLSKTAGFTGMRCGYTVIPRELKRGGVSANALWLRRQSTKFNGVSYIVQRGAAAVFTERGLCEIQKNTDYYKNNAKIISDCMKKLGIRCTGGINSPYVWLKCSDGTNSWRFFDELLNKVQVVGTPGAGFGKNGEGYFRLTAFGSAETTTEAVERIRRFFK